MSSDPVIASGSFRNVGVDLVRLLGIVAIVAGHVWAISPVRDMIYIWHVPVFFVLSGYLWRPGRSIHLECRTRAKSLLIPYACWLAILGALFLGFMWTTDEFSWKLVARMVLGGSYVGRPFSAFWFVTALFIGAVLLRMLERLGLHVAWIVALGGLAAAAIDPNWVARPPLAAGIAVPVLAFLLVGVHVRRVRDRIPAPILLGAVAFTVVIAAAQSGIVASVDMKTGDFGTPVFSVAAAAIASVALILLGEGLAQGLGTHSGSSITWLAQFGLMVVLTHAAVLFLLRTPDNGRLLDFVVALGVPLAGAAIVAHWSLARWLLGVEPRRYRS